ncbi:hypothetical protein D3C87_1636400 [compost metagenome]
MLSADLKITRADGIPVTTVLALGRDRVAVAKALAMASVEDAKVPAAEDAKVTIAHR